MEPTKSNSALRGNVLWLLAMLGLAAAFFIRSNPAIVSAAKEARFGFHSQTVLPARIEPVVQFELIAEYGGTVRNIQTSAGSQVQTGAVLMLLENQELSAEAVAASKRLEVAGQRLQLAGLKPKAGAVEREHSQLAQQDHLAAIDRLNNHSLAVAERADQNAKKRVKEVRALFDRDLATAIEVESAEAAVTAASRDLASAREHRSRLEQEVAQTASRLRIAELQAVQSPALPTGHFSEVEEAQAAVNVTQERLNRLRIVAPGAGTLIELLVREGERVASGRRLGRIADLSSVMVSAPVSAQVAQGVSVGQAIRVRLPLQAQGEVAAIVTEVTRVPDPLNQAFYVRTVVRNPNPSSPLVGLSATIELNHLEVK
jgi:multidrug efflux pump subunit AcrA (membrane-fusion protein)